MGRYCYLHVGTGKTGSSAIQWAFTNAHDQLFERGYLYPDMSQNFERAKLGMPTPGNAFAIQRALRARKPKKAIALIRQWADLSKHLVLSCEALWNEKHSVTTQEAFVAGLRTLGYETKCLVIFRPQVDLAVSSYLQLAKAGKMIPLRRHARRFWRGDTLEHDLNWYERATHLERVYGDISVAWYPALRRSRPDGVVNAAFEWLGIAGSARQELKLNHQTINPSPGLESLILLQVANARGLGGRTFADEFLTRAEAAGLRGSRVQLHRADFDRIYQTTFVSNRKLIEKYCPDLNADDELRRPNAGNWRLSADEATLTELAKIACGVIVEQSRRNLAYEDLLQLFIREITTVNPSRLVMHGTPFPRRGRGPRLNFTAVRRFVRSFLKRAGTARDANRIPNMDIRATQK